MISWGSSKGGNLLHGSPSILKKKNKGRDEKPVAAERKSRQRGGRTDEKHITLIKLIS